MQNIYVTGNDPLMRTPSYSNPSDLDLEIIRLQQAQQQLEQKKTAAPAGSDSATTKSVSCMG